MKKLKENETQETKNDTEDIIEVLKKRWYQSKMITFNMAVAIFAGLGVLVMDESFKNLVGDYFPYVLSVVTIVNIYLRTMTSESIEKMRQN